MWKGTGRSGIGDQAIIGEYDDWDGLSMNGRQWKNRITKETRDLSGADYWHQRKALEPKIPDDIPTFVNGKPNIQAFSEEAQKAQSVKPKKTAFQTVALADSHYERLCGLSDALDVQLDNKELSLEDWSYARKSLDKRLEKAWSRLCKERGWDENEEETVDSLIFDTKDFEIVKQKSYDFSIIPQSSIFYGLSDGNSIKKLYTNWLTAKEMVCKVWDVSKQIVEQGLL